LNAVFSPITPVRLGRRILRSPLLSALTTPSPLDRYLESINPDWSLRDVRAEVTEVRRQTAKSVTLTLRPNDNWRGFESGQFVWVTVEIDGIWRKRTYSVANSPLAEDGLLELTVTTHPKGLISGYFAEHSHPGMVVRLSQAEGDFVLPEDRPQRLLLISGGSGITPVVSMLRTLCDEKYSGEVTFVHYARNARGALYRDELKKLAADNPSVRVVIAHTRDDKGDVQGHLTKKQLVSIAPDFADCETYVCGPSGLIDSARSIWTKQGSEDSLHVEHFVPPLFTVDAAGAKGTIHFAKSDQQAPNNGDSLLAQAERAGLKPKHGCRMGVCHSCTCRKLNGSVRDIRTGKVSAANDEYIQICVSVPVGSVELEI